MFTLQYRRILIWKNSTLGSTCSSPENRSTTPNSSRSNRNSDQQSLIEQQKKPSTALGHFFSALSMQMHDDTSRSYPRRTRHCENVISCKKHCTWSRSCI